MKVWPFLLIVSGPLFLVGGRVHPNADPALPQAAGIAQELGDPAWLPGHALQLAGVVGLVLGLAMLAHDPGLELSRTARRAAGVAGVVGIAYIVESTFHMLAYLDRPALLADGSTPILDTYLIMANIVRPIFMAALAVFALSATRTVTRPLMGLLMGLLVGVLGALGAVAYGIAALLTAPGPIVIEPLERMFPSGARLFCGWAVVFGIAGAFALRRVGRAAGPAANARFG